MTQNAAPAQPANDGQPGQAAADAFEMACRQTHKAWSSTSLLARTQLVRVEELLAAFRAGSPGQLATFMASLVTGSLGGYALNSPLNQERALKLGQLTVQAAADALRGAGAPLARAELLKEVLVHWLRLGEHPNAPDLKRIDQLVGGSAETRLGILAAYAPAVETCIYVLRAEDEKWFQTAASAEQPKQATS